MRRYLPGLLVISLFAPPARVGADVLLTFQRNAPEMVSPSGHVLGGRTTARILLGADRVREEVGESVKILRRDTHALYVTAGTDYCQFRFPLDLKAELSRELYENLMLYPREEGQATIKTSKLPNRKVGAWKAIGTRIEIRGPQSWRKVSIWVTDELPQIPYQLVSDLRLALAPLARSGVTLAFYQELAKLPGVPVRIEIDMEDPMLGLVHTDEELVRVEQRAATDDDYLPPKGHKLVSSDLCSIPSAGIY
jgi:hypothetical protein